MNSNDRPRLLIIDDTPQSIEVLAEILRPDDYQIRFAMNWQKAVELMQITGKPDLILLDVMMPEIDGFEVCKKLKADPDTAKIPIIFITALGDHKDEEIGLSLGAVDYISKPLQSAIVRSRVKTHLDLQLAIKALAQQNEILQENSKLREEVELITRHDLKGPLTALLNIPALIMADGNFSSDQREMLQTVEQSARRMLEMINRSLDLVKIEMKTYELNAVPVDLYESVRRILRELTSLSSFRQLKFKIQLNGKPAEHDFQFFAMCEELMIETIFLNLIKNAIEAAPEDSSITINFTHGSPAMIEIANRGAIPEEIRHRFFEKFQTRGKKRGTGLGAYSARLFARTMGGELFAESQDPDTTILRLTLPAATIDDTSISASKAGKSILIVDKSPMMQKYLTKLIGIAGFKEVTSVANITEAISHLEQNPVGCVLSDYNLNNETGIDLLQRIKKKPECAAIKVCLFTSGDNPEIKAQAINAGADGFLDPPLTISRLKKIINF